MVALVTCGRTGGIAAARAHVASSDTTRWRSLRLDPLDDGLDRTGNVVIAMESCRVREVADRPKLVVDVRDDEGEEYRHEFSLDGVVGHRARGRVHLLD